jgi:hypothetical protein
MKFFWGARMQKLKVAAATALMMAAMALPASADGQQGAAASAPARNPNATMLAKQLKCGGEELQCGPNLVKVCNPANNKCCCATAGTYR